MSPARRLPAPGQRRPRRTRNSARSARPTVIRKIEEREAAHEENRERVDRRRGVMPVADAGNARVIRVSPELRRPPGADHGRVHCRLQRRRQAGGVGSAERGPGVRCAPATPTLPDERGRRDQEAASGAHGSTLRTAIDVTATVGPFPRRPGPVTLVHRPVSARPPARRGDRYVPSLAGASGSSDRPVDLTRRPRVDGVSVDRRFSVHEPDATMGTATRADESSRDVSPETGAGSRSMAASSPRRCTSDCALAKATARRRARSRCQQLAAEGVGRGRSAARGAGRGRDARRRKTSQRARRRRRRRRGVVGLVTQRRDDRAAR